MELSSFPHTLNLQVLMNRLHEPGVMEGIIAGGIIWIIALRFLVHSWKGIHDYHA